MDERAALWHKRNLHHAIQRAEKAHALEQMDLDADVKDRIADEAGLTWRDTATSFAGDVERLRRLQNPRPSIFEGGLGAPAGFW
eukprot:COSAG02_NODE_10677_length_1885_cov_2.860022_2_plen_84_part_00